MVNEEFLEAYCFAILNIAFQRVVNTGTAPAMTRWSGGMVCKSGIDRRNWLTLRPV